MRMYGRWITGFLAGLSLTSAANGAAPSHELMLRQLIQDAVEGRIQYQTLEPRLAEAVRPQAATAKSELTALGALKSVTLQTTQPSGMEIYRTVFEKGALDWAFHVDAQGRIDNALYRPANPDPS